MQQQDVIRSGMRVAGSDGAEVGTVERILASPDGDSFRLLLSGGGPAIPGDVVSSVHGDTVRLKLSASTARSTAWGEVPADFTPTDSLTLQSSSVGTDEHILVPRYEERLEAEKTWTEAGTVRVQKSVVEQPQTLDVELAREVYNVQRVPVNRPWQPGDDQVRTEGDTIIVPVISETIEVLRRKVVVEELRLSKQVVTEHQQITDTVRREVVDVSGPVTGDVPGSVEQSS